MDLEVAVRDEGAETSGWPRVVVLAGGVGGSRFVLGMRAALRNAGCADTAASLTVVINTGDDVWLSGVRLQPDVDSIMYALAGVNDAERGWGRAGESERVSGELREWGAGWPWFTLGDLDLGTHLARTGWLREGLSASQVLERMAGRWELGARLLPMTDAEVDTVVTVAGGGSGTSGGSDVRQIHFQEWWTRYRATLTPLRFDNPGIADAVPAPGVVEAIAAADLVVFAPSNPVVSLGPILAVPGIAEAVRAARTVVGVSPIIAGRVVRGMADVCLTAIGVQTSAAAVAAHYGARAAGGFLDHWYVDEADRGEAEAVRGRGLGCTARPLWMTEPDAAAGLAAAVLARAGG